jgi:hypothetical protein
VTWAPHREVWDPSRGSSLYSRRSWTLPGGSGCVSRGPALSRGGRPTIDTMEYIVSSGHVAAPMLPTWRGQALFATWLEAAAWTLRLHTVVRGTSNSGYRQWPSGPPQGRKRACRWGQSLIGDWHAASVRLLTQLLPVRLWSRQLSCLSPRLADPWSPHLMVLLSHVRGALMPLHWF